MRSTLLWITLAMVPFSLANGQGRDTTSQRADSLRHRIEERFARRVQEQLSLTDDQAAKLRVTSREYDTRRRELASRTRAVRQAITAQLQPGVAANQDSVAKLTDALIQLRMAEAQAARDELKDQSKYLNAVQRARLYTMRERFAHRVKEVHGHRKGHGEGYRRRHQERKGAPWL